MNEIGSILVGSHDPERLRTWYERAFGVTHDANGFLPIGVGLLVEHRTDIGPRSVEPGRAIFNVHVDDAHATAAALDALGAPWVSALEYREDSGAWFGTVADPDGGYVQIIEFTEAYDAVMAERETRD